jgi:hypothetical protein
MHRRTILIISLVGIIILFLLLAFRVFQHPIPMPNPQFTDVTSVHALRIDYLDTSNARQEVSALENQMQQAGINMVALSAGRVDWTNFPWAGHPDRWSSEVKHTGIDYLAVDSERFGKWAHVSAVVDLLAPRYIQSRPEQAAISFSGVPSNNLVSTMDLVEGQFGQDVLNMIEYIAANYPVNSIVISELVYYVDGFGDNDKAAFMSYTGQPDWPRTASGEIDIDHPSIGAWRVNEIGRFLEKAATIVHQYNKLLFVEVRVDLDPGGNVVVKNGTDLNAFLQYADRLVVWGNHDMGGQPAGAISQVASYLTQFGAGRVVMMIGLWDKLYSPDAPKDQMTAIPAGDLKVMLQSADQAGIPDLWISPSFLMSQDYWSVVDELWGGSPTSP